MFGSSVVSCQPQKVGLTGGGVFSELPKSDKRNVAKSLANASTIFKKFKGVATDTLPCFPRCLFQRQSPRGACGFHLDAPCKSRGAVNLVPACRQTVLLGFWEAFEPQG